MPSQISRDATKGNTLMQYHPGKIDRIGSAG
jgi:hypothetical protein